MHNGAIFTEVKVTYIIVTFREYTFPIALKHYVYCIIYFLVQHSPMIIVKF